MNISEILKKYINKREEEELGFAEEINEDNFLIPAEADYVDFGEETEDWDVATEKPGLWENIRKKKERMGKKYKPAKPGDKDRPDPKAWKKAQGEDGEMAIQQLMKMKDQLTEMEVKIKMPDSSIEFEEWTVDMVSKAEIYIQNIYDFVKYYNLKDEDEDEEETEAVISCSDYFGLTTASEYQGRKVTLNKPFRTPSGPKKFSVYVKNEKGNVIKVNFGDPNMKIKKNIPERRKSFRARHKCDTAKDKTTPRYWSCKMW